MLDLCAISPSDVADHHFIVCDCRRSVRLYLICSATMSDLETQFQG